MRGTRALLALVIAMGVLVVVGTTALVAIVVHRLTHPNAVAADGAPPVPATTAPATVLAEEPAGTRITALARQSDMRLAIALTGGGPDRVLVWDIAAGRVLAEIRLGR